MKTTCCLDKEGDSLTAAMQGARQAHLEQLRKQVWEHGAKEQKKHGAAINKLHINMIMSMYVSCIVSIWCSPCGPPSLPPNDAQCHRSKCAILQLHNLERLQILQLWRAMCQNAEYLQLLGACQSRVLKHCKCHGFGGPGINMQQNAGFREHFMINTGAHVASLTL